MEYYRSQVLICTGTGCSSSNSPAIIKRFEECIRNAGLENEIKVVRTGCFGLCENGPICIVYPEGAFYSHIKVDDVERIVSEHLVKGRVVADLLYKKSVTEDGKIRSLEEIDFYKKQKRVALRNCGVIDPENINEYIAFDGYKALAKALTEMSRDDVIDVILKSGLRGRGGAGFPTGLKGRPALRAGGDGHCGLRNRLSAGLYIRPRGIPHSRKAAAHSYRPGAGGRASRQGHIRHRL